MSLGFSLRPDSLTGGPVLTVIILLLCCRVIISLPADCLVSLLSSLQEFFSLHYLAPASKRLLISIQQGLVLAQILNLHQVLPIL